MKAISIRQPWAWLIAAGYKDVENRSWPTSFRGRFLIHASKTFDEEGYELVVSKMRVPLPKPSQFELGGIVGEAEIIDCVTRSESRWFSGPYAFVIVNAKLRPFAPLSGKLGFFEVEREEEDRLKREQSHQSRGGRLRMDQRAIVIQKEIGKVTGHAMPNTIAAIKLTGTLRLENYIRILSDASKKAPMSDFTQTVSAIRVNGKSVRSANSRTKGKIEIPVVGEAYDGDGIYLIDLGVAPSPTGPSGGASTGGGAGGSGASGKGGGKKKPHRREGDNGEDDNGADDNGGADNGGSDNGGSDNEGSDNEGSDNEGSDNEGSDNEGSDNEGNGNGGDESPSLPGPLDSPDRGGRKGKGRGPGG